MKNVKMLAYAKANQEGVNYLVINEDDIVNFAYNEDLEEYEIVDNGLQGVRIWNGNDSEDYINSEYDCDYFQIFDTVIETIKIDFRTGMDLVKFNNENDEIKYQLSSRWSGSAGSMIDVDYENIKEYIEEEV